MESDAVSDVTTTVIFFFLEYSLSQKKCFRTLNYAVKEVRTKLTTSAVVKIPEKYSMM